MAHREKEAAEAIFFQGGGDSICLMVKMKPLLRQSLHDDMAVRSQLSRGSYCSVLRASVDQYLEAMAWHLAVRAAASERTPIGSEVKNLDRDNSNFC